MSELRVDPRARTVAVSVSELDTALAAVADTHPHLTQCMDVARAMLCRLDTIRDEARLGSSLLRHSLARGDLDLASRNLESIREVLGERGKRHELEVSRVRTMFP